MHDSNSTDLFSSARRLAPTTAGAATSRRGSEPQSRRRPGPAIDHDSAPLHLGAANRRVADVHFIIQADGLDEVDRRDRPAPTVGPLWRGRDPGRPFPRSTRAARGGGWSGIRTVGPRRSRGPGH